MTSCKEVTAISAAAAAFAMKAHGLLMQTVVYTRAAPVSHMPVSHALVPPRTGEASTCIDPTSLMMFACMTLLLDG